MWKPENAEEAILKLSVFLLQSANTIVNYSHLCKHNLFDICFRLQEFTNHMVSFIF